MKPKCPKCKAALLYVEKTFNYWSIDNVDRRGNVDLGVMDDSVRDDTYFDHYWCNACEAAFDKNMRRVVRPRAVQERPVKGPKTDLYALPLSLTKVDWAEVAAALESKSRLVERGDYGEANPEEGFDPKKWSRHLERIYNKIDKALTKAGMRL